MQKVWEKLKTIKISLLMMVLICWLLPTLVLGFFMGTRFFQSLQDKTEAALISGAEHAQVLALKNISHVITLAKDVTYDGELSQAVRDYEAEKITYQEYFKIVRNYLERKYSRESLCDFAIFFRTARPQQLHFTSQAFFASLTFAENAQKKVMRLCDFLDTRCRFVEENGTTYLVRNLYNTRMERYGILVLGVNMPRLLESVATAAKRWDSQYALQLDDYTTGSFYGDQTSAGLEEHGDKLCYTQMVKDYDYLLRYQTQTDKAAVYREMGSFRALMAWLLILLLPVCVLVMLFVQKRIVRPIELLASASSRIEDGELGVVVPMRGTDELGRLGSAFSKMSIQIKHLIDQSYKEEIALRDARIKMMQSQINPHFLNNALEAINWQARIDENETVAEMVEALSVLLNASMDRSERHLVPLKEELHIADAYFYFISLRFGQRLTVWKDIAPQAMEAPVPRLVIHTLIENAIEHGIAPAGGGRIWLNVFVRENVLMIEVINNGQKLSAEDVARIARLLDDREPDEGHLGIRNVSQRLNLLFGQEAKLTIQPGAHGETVATIRLPVSLTQAQRQTTNDILG